MKTLLKLLVFVFISITLLNCTKDEVFQPANLDSSSENFYKHSDEDDDIPIRGKVVNSTGMPIISAVVDLSLQGNPSILRSVTTNSFGKYTFENVNNNSYNIKISKANYYSKNIEVNVASSSVNIDTLFLQ
ncbi:MAG: hypothetical protein B6D61_02350 [Bacteroidetes bacterium 4484_249]|nr:MAG: hypothetical protein B6D61_02350 [Bacteroidetes bacterium 4484_249]